eukprot:gene32017-18225_t
MAWGPAASSFSGMSCSCWRAVALFPQVCVRVRPLSGAEKTASGERVLRLAGDGELYLRSAPKASSAAHDGAERRFCFDRAFRGGPGRGQRGTRSGEESAGRKRSAARWCIVSAVAAAYPAISAAKRKEESQPALGQG